MRSVNSQSANLLHLIAITLSLTLLVACGGGGGGGGGTAAPTTTGNPNMPGTNDPMTRPTLALSDLANFESSAMRESVLQAFSGILSSSTISLSAAYQSGMLSGDAHLGCNPAGNNSPSVCSVLLPGYSGDTLGFVADSNDLSLVRAITNNYLILGSYNSRTTPSVDVDDVTFARGILMAERSDNTPLEFQTFAGWLDNSIFGTMQITVGETSPEYRFISYAAGVPATNNPSAMASETSATWEGAVVGSIKASRTFILGDASVTVNFTDTNVDVMLDEWYNINGQPLSMDAITYNDLALTNGAFEGSGNEQVEGRFYGQDHAEVSGFFNTMEVSGAFGGKRMQ